MQLQASSKYQLTVSRMIAKYRDYRENVKNIHKGSFPQSQWINTSLYTMGSRDSLLVRVPDSWSKGCQFESWQERWKNFLLQSKLCVLTLIQCPFHPLVTTVARKSPGHTAITAGGRLHLNTHTSLSQRSQSGLTMPLSRHSVGTYQETSSHATRQGALGYSRISSLSHCGLILV